MKHSVEVELKGYLLGLIDNGTLTDYNVDEWHKIAFNEDYYITYYYRSLGWLKNHSFDVFHAINTVRDYEVENYGCFSTEIEPECIVNMLVYIYGEEIINNSESENINELKEYLNNL